MDVRVSTLRMCICVSLDADWEMDGRRHGYEHACAYDVYIYMHVCTGMYVCLRYCMDSHSNE